MNFIDAMNLIRTGGKVSRESWDTGSTNVLYVKAALGVTSLVLSGTPALSFGSYAPSDSDIVAADWYLTTAV